MKVALDCLRVTTVLSSRTYVARFDAIGFFMASVPGSAGTTALIDAENATEAGRDLRALVRANHPKDSLVGMEYTYELGDPRVADFTIREIDPDPGETEPNKIVIHAPEGWLTEHPNDYTSRRFIEKITESGHTVKDWLGRGLLIQLAPGTTDASVRWQTYVDLLSQYPDRDWDW